jgi:hypothetical protein
MPARGNSYQRRRFGTRPEKHPVSPCSSPNPHGSRRGERAEVDLLGVFEFVSGVVRLMGTLLFGIASLIFWATQTVRQVRWTNRNRRAFDLRHSTFCGTNGLHIGAGDFAWTNKADFAPTINT